MEQTHKWFLDELEELDEDMYAVMVYWSFDKNNYFIETVMVNAVVPCYWKDDTVSFEYCGSYSGVYRPLPIGQHFVVMYSKNKELTNQEQEMAFAIAAEREAAWYKTTGVEAV